MPKNVHRTYDSYVQIDNWLYITINYKLNAAHFLQIDIKGGFQTSIGTYYHQLKKPFLSNQYINEI